MNFRILLLMYLVFITTISFGQQYKEWEEHDVVKFYEKKEITLEYNSLDENGDDMYDNDIIYYVPTKVKDDVYEIEVYEKVSSKLWQIKGTNIYMKFRYNPYLYKWDEGVLEVSYNSGTFYKKE
ncbi:hypothetical protein L3073_07875 [Ancylomarina sp. DW003]|nr:hypothetical protein [Ancylomarina sp. DW003]MDE5422123.1 hypothetical protein [Ancylomarina sp. DW003]